MEEDVLDALKALKREYLELERVRAEERACLLKVVNTFAVVAAMHEGMAAEVQAVKKLAAADQDLPLDRIEEALGRFKDKIIARAGETVPDGVGPARLRETEQRLLEACRILRKIMAVCLEDFYPVSAELEARARAIRINCRGDAARIDVKKPTAEFLSFLGSLKAKISEDFRSINQTFLVLLDHVKELEKTLSADFGSKGRLQEIEYFEMKVNTEVGSIVDTFNIHTNIGEIRKAVVDRIKNIKNLIALKKRSEVKRAKKAEQNIKSLQQRIGEAEKDAREMAKLAEQFQTAAMKDGLTGLHNRKAFDLRLENALGALRQGGEPFLVILFDVNRFKAINDTFGHVAGDKVLIKVAECLRETFRENDFIARYGGDEYAVVIEKMSEAMARERVQNFERNLKKRRFVSYAKGEIAITASAGIAPARPEDNPEDLIDRADREMYASKQEKT